MLSSVVPVSCTRVAASTTFMFVVLPYVVLKEGVDMQRAQDAHQKAVLLGPSAAIGQAASHAASHAMR